MYSSAADVDELIETEVCSRLIRLSCAKMVNSKNERGGAKLHRNLLILHLLRRARSEQNKPMVAAPDLLNLTPREDCSGAVSVAFTAPILQCTDNPQMYSHTGEQIVYENGINPYFDLTDSNSMRNGTNCDSGPNILVENNTNSRALSEDLFQLQFESDRIQLDVALASQEPRDSEIPMMISAPLPIECSLCEGNSCAFIPEQASFFDNAEDEGNYELNNSRQRKRKTSMSQSCSSTTPKKCCVEERQFTGLMSVFNSGLSVVADQLLPRPATGPLLQPASDQLVPSLVRIACNPLIC